MTYFRLRPGVRHPAFLAGELYRFIEETQPAGYIFLELMGKPRCVPEHDFERIDNASDETPRLANLARIHEAAER